MRVSRRVHAAFGAAQVAALRSAPMRQMEMVVPLPARAGGPMATPAAAARPCLRWTGARPSSTSSSGEAPLARLGRGSDAQLMSAYASEARSRLHSPPRIPF